MTDQLEECWQSFIKELGADRLSTHAQQQILEAASRVVQKRVTLRISLELTDAQVDQFEHIAKLPGDQMLHVLQQAYPNFIHIYQQEIGSLKDDLLGVEPPVSHC